MILSDSAIADAIERGDIVIDPYDPQQMNPSSYDLTLGDQVRTYDFPSIYDVRDEPTKFRNVRIDNRGFVIHPGRGYLMHTVERVGSRKYVPVLDGKSSMGRLFIAIHVTAGFGDVGFLGQWTLEVTTVYSIRLYAGMRIGQMRFHSVDGAIAKPYAGNYVGETATGPVASRAWRQF